MEAWISSASIFLLFPIVLVTLASIAFWLMLLYFMSQASGWRELARRHRLAGPFPGRRQRFCSAIFKEEVRYRGVLTIGVCEDGLYLALMAPFSYCHPPMLIPWRFVRKAGPGGPKHRRTELELGEKPGVRVSVNADILDMLERSASGALLKAI